MKIDLRPAVISKTMTKELILASLSILAVISKLSSPLQDAGLPLYFLKVKPILQRYADEKEKNDEKKALAQISDENKQRIAYAKENYRLDPSMTTQEKALRLSPEQMEQKIRQLERQNAKAILQ